MNLYSAETSSSPFEGFLLAMYKPKRIRRVSYRNTELTGQQNMHNNAHEAVFCLWYESSLIS